MATEGSRSSLVEQNSHSRDFQRPGGVFQYGANLLRRNARKPIQKVLDRCPIFNVLEQRSYRHASTSEYPRSADAIGIAFDIRA